MRRYNDLGFDVMLGICRQNDNGGGREVVQDADSLDLVLVCPPDNFVVIAMIAVTVSIAIDPQTPLSFRADFLLLVRGDVCLRTEWNLIRQIAFQQPF